jgi:hypothetical protein
VREQEEEQIETREEAAALREEAGAWMARERVASPARMIAMVAPGIDE